MKLYFRVSNEVIAENLKKGIELKKNQIIDLDFSSMNQDDRTLLMRHLKVENDILYAGINQESTTGSYFGRQDDMHYGCFELSGVTPEEIVSFYKNFEADEFAKKQAANEVVRKAKALQEKFDSSDFRIYLQDQTGKYETIHFEYKGKQYTPGVWSKISEIEKAIEDGSLSVWMKNIDEEKEKITREREEKAAAEKARKEELEQSRLQLLTWATKNGSDLLKLRIKHEQNWQDLAQKEWAISISVGFKLWQDENPDDEWQVKNATLEQLVELEKAQSENPNHEITIERCKFIDKSTFDYPGDDTVEHRTFLRCDIVTPVGVQSLYKEIPDVSDEDDE